MITIPFILMVLAGVCFLLESVRVQVKSFVLGWMGAALFIVSILLSGVH
jgi:hypothetical protein